MTDLASIPVQQAWLVQRKAQLRLTLFLTARTHQVFGGFGKTMRGALQAHATGEGKLDGTGLVQVQRIAEREWGKTFEAWKRLFQAERTEAGTLPFGTLTFFHNKLIVPMAGQVAEAGPVDLVFSPQLRAVMDAANRRIHTDGLPLSSRIWNLDKDSYAGIQGVLFNGVAKSQSAWAIADQLEQFLGYSEECPRWTAKRLYGMTKEDIAQGNLGGLWSNSPTTRARQRAQGLKEGQVGCDGRGISYYALRMARTELQAVHSVATDLVMDQMPWVEEEQIVLSRQHAQKDECDEVVAQGRGGKGIYPKGQIRLPLHPQCICYKVAVHVGTEQFAKRVRSWMRGEKGWSAMDRYAQQYGVDTTLKGEAIQVLGKWAFGKTLSLAAGALA